MTKDMIRNVRATAVAAALMASAGGCAAAAMSVPADLASAPRMEVRGRQGWMPGSRVGFGEYATSRVRRRERTPHVNVGFFTDRAQFDASYVFRLSHAEAPVAEAACGTWADVASTRIPLGDLRMTETRDATLACDILLEPGGVDADRWLLELRARRGTQLSGTLENGADAYHVQATTALAGGAGAPCCSTTGYVVRDADGRTVAAVEVINDGAVWLHPSLRGPEREVLATASAALLLLSGVPEEMPSE